jgi:hypothetical protein
LKEDVLKYTEDFMMTKIENESAIVRQTIVDKDGFQTPVALAEHIPERLYKKVSLIKLMDKKKLPLVMIDVHQGKFI